MEDLFSPNDRLARLMRDEFGPYFRPRALRNIWERELDISLDDLSKSAFNLQDFMSLFDQSRDDTGQRSVVVWMSDYTVICGLFAVRENARLPEPYGLVRVTVSLLLSTERYEVALYSCSTQDMATVLSTLYQLAAQCQGALFLNVIQQKYNNRDDLSLFSVTNESLTQLASSGLPEIRFGTVRFSGEQVQALCNSCSEHLLLRFGNCRFDDNGDALFRALCSDTGPAQLDLGVTGDETPFPFPRERWGTFVSSIASTTCLRSLYLFGLPKSPTINEQEYLQLAEGLKHNASLINLYLVLTEECNLAARARILEALHTHPSLRKLLLKGTDFPFFRDRESTPEHVVQFTRHLADLVTANECVEEVVLLFVHKDRVIYEQEVQSRLDLRRFRSAVRRVEQEQDARRPQLFVDTLVDIQDDESLVYPLDIVFFLVSSNADLIVNQA